MVKILDPNFHELTTGAAPKCVGGGHDPLEHHKWL